MVFYQLRFLLDYTKINECFNCTLRVYQVTLEVESLRTSLASRMHFEVFGLGLEFSTPRKLSCPRLGTALFFESIKFCWKTLETSRKIFEHLFCFPQLEHNRSQRGGGDQVTPPQLKFHQWQKCAKKAYNFFSFSFFLAFFACNSN